MVLFNVKPMIKFMGQMMIDSCKIERNNRNETFNSTTGQYSSDVFTLIYHGQCSVSALRTQRPTARTDLQGGALELDVSVWLTLPLSFTAAVNPKDLVTILTSNNPNLVGQVFIIREDAEVSTYSAARRFLLHRYTRIPN